MDSEKLIELVRQYEFLYDVNHSKHGDIKKKVKIWQEIGTQLNQPASVCKRTWINLREAFRRVLKKRKDNKSGQPPKKIRKWKYEEEMSFMVPYYSERPSLISQDVQDEEVSNDSNNANIPEAILENSDHSDNSQTEKPLTVWLSNVEKITDPISSESEKASCSRVRTEEPPRKNKTPITASSDLMEYFIKRDEMPQLDDLDKFFLSISATVKKFSSYNIVIAKSKIFSLVSSLELSEIEKQIPSTTQTSAAGGGFLKTERTSLPYCSDLETSSTFKKL